LHLPGRSFAETYSDDYLPSMGSSESPRSFADAAVRAFPAECSGLAGKAAKELAPLVKRDEVSSTPLIIGNARVHIPDRLYFQSSEAAKQIARSGSVGARCLLTRSDNGYVRQIALQNILRISEPWAPCFIVPLAAEYVVEIAQDIAASFQRLDPAAFAAFAKENRETMRVLRARATSYWACYYRNTYPEKVAYPGLIVLQQIEQWAS
jgi:hypothetical protein